MQTKVSLGIDIGGTNTVFGIIDQAGKCYAEGTLSTQAYNNIQDFITKLHADISTQLDSLDILPIGVGIGAPNGNYYNGTIEHAANLYWKGIIPIVELIEKKFKLPAVVTNDAKAAAIGEMIYGGAKGMKNFVVITLGTGLGSGIVVNGQLVYGNDGLAGELGHTIVHPHGRACNCGRRGCLETYVSATGIKRTACELLATENIESQLRDIPFHQLTAKRVYEAAEKGDPIALEAFQHTGEELGSALANLVAITSPEAIFLQGGVANAGEWLFKTTQEQMEKNLLHVYKQKVKILRSSLPVNAAIFGASALAWNELG